MHGTIETMFHVERRPLQALAPIVADWRALAARAVEPNAFYEPAFALAAAPTFGRHVQVFLVWTRQTPARLAGLFPCAVEWRYGLVPRVLGGWTHPFALLGTPLVDRDLCEGAIAAWLDHVAADPRLPALAMLPKLAVEGPFVAALDRVLAMRGAACAEFGLHRRALLAPGSDRAHYLAQSLGAKHRKELPRRRRRLAELGAVTHDVATDEASILPALDCFLALEAAGWKGKAGTAAAQRLELRDFFRNAIAALAREGKARIDLMRLDGKPIAATVALRSGDMMFGWKTAYDEAYAKYSPGSLLMVELSEAVIADPSITAMDSCAVANHPLIDHLWCGRRAIADRLLALRPEQRAVFNAARALEWLRRGAIQAAKTVRDRTLGPLSRAFA